MQTLPRFKYYPTADQGDDPMVAPSDRECLCCQTARGFLYRGPVFADQALEEVVCPWCVADGSAHKKFEAMFNPIANVRDPENGAEIISSEHNRLGDWQSVPQEIIDEIAYRTPAVASWQEAKWFFHCNDGATYLGPVGAEELQNYGPKAIEAIAKDAREMLQNEQAAERWMELLSRDGSPTAYLFKCEHCGAFGGFSDCD